MYDMTITLRSDGEKHLYEQIYEHIRHEIWEGRLLAGERLPSTRSLADYLQVARSTVDYAYSQLIDEGYIEARPHRGYFVCSLEGILKMERSEGIGAWNVASERGEHPEGDQSPTECAEDSPCKDGESERTLVKCRYDFSPHGVDMSVFPFSVWNRITKKVLSEGNSELFARGDAQGDMELRSTISRYLHSSRGVECTPDRIIIGAGNDYMLMLLEKILGRHVEVAMENPTYMRTWRIFQSFAYPVTIVPSDESGMTASGLAQTRARVAYVMPSHQFPLGTVMPIGRRTELLKWADEEEGRFLIEDDYDSEFRYKGKPIPSLQSSDEHDKVIYMGTFSKSIAPAIRVSYMVLPRELIKVYREKCFFYSCTVSRIDQSILNEFIRDGYFERHLNKMRKIYRSKHDLLLRELQPFADRFQITGENGGLHILLHDRYKGTERELVSSAAGKGVKVHGISEYCIRPLQAENACILIGFGAMSESDILSGIQKLKEAWL